MSVEHIERKFNLFWFKYLIFYLLDGLINSNMQKGRSGGFILNGKKKIKVISFLVKIRRLEKRRKCFFFVICVLLTNVIMFLLGRKALFFGEQWVVLQIGCLAHAFKFVFSIQTKVLLKFCHCFYCSNSEELFQMDFYQNMISEKSIGFYHSFSNCFFVVIFDQKYWWFYNMTT